ncbi:Palmitoyltransferase pfa5 [Elasticomyces elasticus]|nr:Palmitoyltransferase pfa5 [Elasticomyces elasticus]
MAICYIRLLATISMNPGYLPQGQRPAAALSNVPTNTEQRVVNGPCTSTTVPEKPTRARATQLGSDDSSESASHAKVILDRGAIFRGEVPPPPGLEQFYSRDVFVCDQSGLPLWCATCCIWKPDRVHHCSDVGRVGGVVGETNFKFFIQFCFYGALFAGFNLVVMAFFVAHQRARGRVSENWTVVLALAGFFTLFALSIAWWNSLFALSNRTTIENIDRARQSMFLAILISETGQAIQPPSPPSELAVPPKRGPVTLGRIPDKVAWAGVITYPLFPGSPLQPISSSRESAASALPKGTARPPRTFAIVLTPPGMNPWALEPLENFRAVMGKRVWDWLIPLRYPPCCDHNRQDGFYPMGATFDQLKRAAGILPPQTDVSADTAGSHRRRRSRRPRREGGEATTLGNVEGESGREERDRRKKRRRKRRTHSAASPTVGAL